MAPCERYAPTHNDNGNDTKLWFDSVEGVTNGDPNYGKDVSCDWEVGPAPSPTTAPSD
jgi:hypothetical protein